ncbi:MAG: CBS domain-containing protein [Pirellulaceae bacterium]|nr:CBS domain-containing protein [Pirellulaceae bacterium]MDP7019865.1 CBS domain-containing protein [Pirellulaceae bacterium]
MGAHDDKRVQLQEAFDACGELSELVVGLIMTPNPICVSPHATGWELVSLFRDRGFRHLLVRGDDNRLLGVISDRDIIRCFGLDDDTAATQVSSLAAEQLMSTDLLTIEPSTRVQRALQVMLEFGVNCLPVCHQDVPVGIITSTDIYLLAEQMLIAHRTQPV